MKAKVIPLEKGWQYAEMRKPLRGVATLAVVDPSAIPELKGTPPFMKITEVMALLACGRDYLYEAIQGGRLEAQRIGKKDYRIRRSALAAFLVAENYRGR